MDKAKKGTNIDPTTYSLAGVKSAGLSRSSEFDEEDVFDVQEERSAITAASSPILLGPKIPKLKTARTTPSDDRLDVSIASSASSTSLHSDQSSSSLPSYSDSSSDISEDDRKRAILDIAFKNYFVQRVSQIMVVATGRGSTPETSLTSGLNTASGIVSFTPIPIVDVGSILNAVNVAIQSRNKKKEIKSAENIMKFFLGDSARFDTEPFREMVADLALEVGESCFDKVKVWSAETKEPEKKSKFSKLKQKLSNFGDRIKGKVKKSELDVVFDVCDAIVEAMESKEVADVFAGLSKDHIEKTAIVGKGRRDYIKGKKDGTIEDSRGPREVFESPRYKGISDPHVRKEVVDILRSKLQKEGILKEEAPSTSPSPDKASLKSVGRGFSKRAGMLVKAVSAFSTPKTGGERQQ